MFGVFFVTVQLCDPSNLHGRHQAPGRERHPAQW